MNVDLRHGDCVELMRAMPDCSVDSVVTDPPYELGFMGKAWDGAGIAYSLDMWREALRVLKPGGHLLAFGGTRTYHRMACAIEDAGFEIRDSIHWTYAVGFPKSLNVKKSAGDKCCQCEQPVPYVHGESDVQRMRDALHDVPVKVEARQEPDVQLPVQRQGSGPGTRQALAQGQVGVDGGIAPLVSVEDDGAEQSGVEGRGDVQASEGELHGGEVRQVPGEVAADGSEGRVHHGASAGDGPVGRSGAGAFGGGKSSEPRSVGQQAGESGTVAGQRGAQAWGGWPVCGRCEQPILPEGLGTALKPAHEPVVVARKPLVGTVAGNVLVWGTGGLNIDGCRVGTDEDTARKPAVVADTAAPFGKGVAMGGRGHASGRWPANIVLDGAAADALDQQQEDAARYFTQADFGPDDWPFVYCAKPSKRERNAGLDRLPERETLIYSEKAQGPLPQQTPSKPSPRANHHPTVKPVALMRHLVRLVTPPGGTVLDPFAGSGTTLVAAVLEGINAIGCEMTDEYLPIIEGRVGWAREQLDSEQPRLM